MDRPLSIVIISLTILSSFTVFPNVQASSFASSTAVDCKRPDVIETFRVGAYDSSICQISVSSPDREGGAAAISWSLSGIDFSGIQKIRLSFELLTYVITSGPFGDRVGASVGFATSPASCCPSDRSAIFPVDTKTTTASVDCCFLPARLTFGSAMWVNPQAENSADRVVSIFTQEFPGFMDDNLFHSYTIEMDLDSQTTVWNADSGAASSSHSGFTFIPTHVVFSAQGHDEGNSMISQVRNIVIEIEREAEADFEIAVSPVSKKVFQGATGPEDVEFQVTVSATGGFSLPVRLECVTCRSPDFPSWEMSARFEPDLGYAVPDYATTFWITTNILTRSDTYVFTLRAVAANGMEKTAELSLTVWTKWAVIVGIKDYRGVGIDYLAPSNVMGAINSALDMYDLLVRKSGFPFYNVHLLTDDTGSRTDDISATTVANELRWLSVNAKPDDMVVFYIASHGQQSDGGEPESISTHPGQLTDDRVTELVSGIRSTRLIIILDISFAGGFVYDKGVPADLALGSPKGRVVVTGCADPSNLLEILAFDCRWFFDIHALKPLMAFTKFLVEAFAISPTTREPFGDINDDGRVSVEEAFEYAKSAETSVFGRIRTLGGPTPEIYDGIDGDIFFDDR